MRSRPPAFPINLIVAFVLLALATSMQVLHIADGHYTFPNYVDLALKLFLVVGLVRGSESARTLAVVVGLLNILVGLLRRRPRSRDSRSRFTIVRRSIGWPPSRVASPICGLDFSRRASHTGDVSTFAATPVDPIFPKTGRRVVLHLRAE